MRDKKKNRLDGERKENAHVCRRRNRVIIILLYHGICLGANIILRTNDPFDDGGTRSSYL